MRARNILHITIACALLLGTAAMAQENADSFTLTDTRWRLVEIQSMDDAIGTTRPDDPNRYTMRLLGDSTVTMRLNCNRANGKWSATPSASGTSGQFGFGPLAMTKMFCPPPSLDEQIAKQTDYVRSYLIRDGRLYLSLMADGGIIVWEPLSDDAEETAVPRAPEDGGPRNWVVATAECRLNLRAEPSTSAEILTRYEKGTLVDNLGVRETGGRFWCDVQQLGGGPRGYVAHEYLKPAVSPDGTVAYGEDDSARRAGEKDFDATGTVSCKFGESQPITQCEFGVSRAGSGYATVVITKPDGRERIIFFRMGIPVSARPTTTASLKRPKRMI